VSDRRLTSQSPWPTGLHPEGWVTAEWGVSETKRQVRFYSLTPDGRKQLRQEMAEYERVSAAIHGILHTA
jgi:PadR family transcriptional regulator, regulatory protein PadR